MLRLDKHICIALTSEQLARLDRLVSKTAYGSRVEFIRGIIEAELVKMEWHEYYKNAISRREEVG